MLTVLPVHLSEHRLVLDDARAGHQQEHPAVEMPQIGNMAQNFSGIHGSESFFDRVKVAISFRFGKYGPRAGFPRRGRGLVWREFRIPALSLLSDTCRKAVCRGRFCLRRGCVRLVLRACPSTRPEQVADARGAARARSFSRPEYACPVQTGCSRRAEIAKSLSCDPAARPVVARKLLPAGSESSFCNQYFPFHSVRIRSAICRSLGLSSGV